MLRCVVLGFPLLFLSLPPALTADQSFLRAAAESNVNQQYTIESILIGGVQIQEAKIPPTLRSRFVALVGERCDVARLQDLAAELRRELHLQAVSQRLLKGSQPGRVRVSFDVVQKDLSFNLSVPSIRYSSEQGASGELDASARAGRNTVNFGVLSIGDELAERFSGLKAAYQNSKLGTERLRFRLQFEDYQTERVDYHRRHNIAPQLTFVVARPLSVSAGLSFEEMKLNNGTSAAANAVTAEVHYGRDIEGDTIQQKFDGRYNLRAGTEALNSDYGYTRHTFSFRYEVKAGRKTATEELTAGAVSGQAPSFERFVLGSHFAPENTPGTRMVHNSMTYGYQFGERTGEAFYDTGTLGHTVRHSAGIAYRQGIFVVAMAFPIGEARFTPIFMAGMNY